MPSTDQTTQLAVQLYTLREHCKTPDDIDRTFGRLADQGWKAVQASALGEIAPDHLRKLLDKHGLACCATHVRPPERLWDDPQGVIEEHETLGCRHTAVGGYFPKGDEFDADHWSAWIDRYNKAAENFKGTSVSIGYHNHSHEFAKLGGKDDYKSRRAWDLLVENLSDDVWFEIDTYWVAHAGGDPAAWLRALKGRVPVIHVKDLAIDANRGQYMAEVGVGNLDWPGVLSAARDAGVEWYVVEQDTCYRDPFDSLQTSLDNLHGMGLR